MGQGWQRAVAAAVTLLGLGDSASVVTNKVSWRGVVRLAITVQWLRSTVWKASWIDHQAATKGQRRGDSRLARHTND